MSARSTAAVTRAFSEPAAAAASICSASRPAVSGRWSIPQAACRSTRADASEAGRPPGSSCGRQPASRAANSPARRGIHAQRRPLAAYSRTFGSSPGTSPARSPTSTMVPSSSSAAIESSACTSSPGAVGTRTAPSFRDPLVRNGATARIRVPFLRLPLRSRRKTAEDSSSGSKPTSTTLAAFSRSVKVTSISRLVTSAARKPASSAP